jgi:hypothetical protein
MLVKTSFHRKTPANRTEPINHRMTAKTPEEFEVQMLAGEFEALKNLSRSLSHI